MRHEKAQRLLDMARLMASSAEGLTLDELALELSVGRRTAERMRDAVEAVFPQMETLVEGGVKRFRIRGGLDGFAQAPTTEELLAAATAAEGLRQQGAHVRAQALEQLLRKVQSAMRSAALQRVVPDLEALMRAEWIAVQAGPRPIEDERTLATIRQALMAMRALRFVYHGGSRPGQARSVGPLGIMFGRINYLVALELGFGTPKSWRLDRIESLEILPESFSPPSGFDLGAFANQSFGYYQSDMADVALRVLKHGIRDDFANWRFNPNQSVEYEPDGSAVVSFRAAGMRELAWHLFSWGDKIEVLAPDALRRLLVDELEAALAHHRRRRPDQKEGAEV
ncbi:MAG: DNA-binding transcriptional regulator [Alphaproteobacteria bacterium]|nr:MAG: DNA-binding transcriptional regulator [Alphaproteobacteria bacterium]